jgi:diacylglycerol kinase (ATP)
LQAGRALSVADRFSLAARLRSFGFAFRGIAVVLRTQHNAWIHTLAAVMVVGLGAALPLSAGDWCWLAAAIALVWIAESLNTAIERLADAVAQSPHPLIRDAKDAGAGAVLIAAVAAAVIGLLVLGPPLLGALRSAP